MAEHGLTYPIPESVPLRNLVGSVSIAGHIGVRDEDRFAVGCSKEGKLCVALADGHCGKAAAEYVTDIKQVNSLGCCSSSRDIEKTFSKLDSDFNKKFSNSTAGSTLTFMSMEFDKVLNDVKISVGHVGDCYLYVLGKLKDSQERKLIQLTDVHDCCNIHERKRIGEDRFEDSCEINSQGEKHGSRLNGDLLVTRAIGDFNKEVKPQGLISTPQVDEFYLKEKCKHLELECIEAILLVSDGVLDGSSVNRLKIETIDRLSLSINGNRKSIIGAADSILLNLNLNTSDDATLILIPFLNEITGDLLTPLAAPRPRSRFKKPTPKPIEKTLCSPMKSDQSKEPLTEEEKNIVLAF
eukprot:GHVL01015064.1.p1 GENE.GHVL01015064.1~~GHVL01015064.1.p1  ORF type:complete len:353 (-),score=80.53 GHVL01015064.1:47-1105(-)